MRSALRYSCGEIYCWATAMSGILLCADVYGDELAFVAAAIDDAVCQHRVGPAGASHHVGPCQFLIRRRIRLREDKLTALREHYELAVRRDNTPLADSTQPPSLIPRA